jgi:hypothetical protein
VARRGVLHSVPISFLGVPVRVTAYPTDDLCAVIRSTGFRIEKVWESSVEVEPGQVERQLFVCAVADPDT